MLPPPSLIVAMTAMTLVALAIGLATARLLKGRSSKSISITAVIGTALLVAHALWLNGNPALATLVRSPDAIVWSNFSPLFAAILAAAAWRSISVPWQRGLFAIVIPALCLTQAYGPLFGRVPPTQPPRIVNGIHRQSTLSTCSAAAAATLLGTAGIDTTESEMATLCLTRESGTLQLGLYRGLRLKCPTTTVEFLNNNLAAVLASDRPVIVSFGAPPGAMSPLAPHVGHSVVILAHSADGTLTIADPMTGGQYPMPPNVFTRTWTGEALRLTSAHPSTP